MFLYLWKFIVLFQLCHIAYSLHIIRSNQEVVKNQLANVIHTSKSIFFAITLNNIQANKVSADETALLSVKSKILLDRVTSLDYSSYKPGIEINDIYFPSWFNGKWKTTSIFTDISVPLGLEVIGGKPVYDRALKDLNSELTYISRFQPDLKGNIIFDRYYNVKQIAEATMGPDSVINNQIENSKPAEFLEISLVPSAVQDRIFFRVQLTSMDRVQSQANDTSFEVMERTKQTIITTSRNASNSNVNNPPGSSNTGVLEKEIETITVYQLAKDGSITAVQRTATFFSPKDPRYPLAFAREPRVANNAIDIRCYQIKMNRIPDTSNIL